MQSGHTPLHFACENGHYQIVEALVKKIFQVKSYLLARLIVNIPDNVSVVSNYEKAKKFFRAMKVEKNVFVRVS